MQTPTHTNTHHHMIATKEIHGKQYKLVEHPGQLPIAYNANESDLIIEILERARLSKTRLRLDYGDIENGQSWGETCDIFGRIGLSKGSEARYPILIHNTRSSGGGSILSGCLVKISESKDGKILYQHPSYHATN